MTKAEVDSYVPEEPDKRTPEQWEAMSLAELRAEWRAQPVFEAPPYPVDRNRFARLTRVRSEIMGRLNTRPPDGLTWGAKGKAS